MMEHVPHCAALQGDRLCNRDRGHTGAHESRSSTGRGCIGWAPSADEEYDRTPPPSDEKLAGLIGGVLAKHGLVPMDPT